MIFIIIAVILLIVLPIAGGISSAVLFVYKFIQKQSALKTEKHNAEIKTMDNKITTIRDIRYDLVHANSTNKTEFEQEKEKIIHEYKAKKDGKPMTDKEIIDFIKGL